jgi:hypothetical protein
MASLYGPILTTRRPIEDLLLIIYIRSARDQTILGLLKQVIMHFKFLTTPLGFDLFFSRFYSFTAFIELNEHFI